MVVCRGGGLGASIVVLLAAGATTTQGFHMGVVRPAKLPLSSKDPRAPRAGSSVRRLSSSVVEAPVPSTAQTGSKDVGKTQFNWSKQVGTDCAVGYHTIRDRNGRQALGLVWMMGV